MNYFSPEVWGSEAHTMSFGHKNPEYTIDGQLNARVQSRQEIMSTIEQLNPGAPIY